jgi:23S rRNA (cytosine1962-C5)-methyltransferase
VNNSAKTEAPLRLRITAAAEGHIRRGHPWVFSDSVRDSNRPGELGELAVIYDKRDRFLAIGLYDPESPLRVRILHNGSPVVLDESWFEQRLRRAIELRSQIFQTDTQTNGYRLINGESDGWPGLVLDKYEQTLVLKLYTAAWFRRLEMITTLIEKQLRPERIVLRLSRNIQELASAKFGQADGRVFRGAPLEHSVVFRETGIQFEADVLRGQKTGFFLDQRENRRNVEKLARGRDVLNAFSFSGGFSLYAARGGARSVTDLDISAHALDSAKRNFALNRADHQIASCAHETLQADVFEWLNDSKRQFDLTLLDPPSLARRASDRPQALQAYSHLIASGIRCTRRGGILLTASCTAHIKSSEFFEIARQAVKRSRRAFRELMITAHPPDHPAAFAEAHYLKAIYFQLLN